jgi:hypothetical protein
MKVLLEVYRVGNVRKATASRALTSTVGHCPDWESHLRGSWNPYANKQRGGRPAKLAHKNALS